MIKTVIATLAGTLIAAASPAATRTEVPAPVSAASIVATADTKQPEATKPAKATRYCVEDLVTGSRLKHRTCQTRDEWLAEGFDPLAK
ncbi:hypothetical protein [Sphingomonas endolithica]|uniref:hypothetical protein n=1 Tax=Sphingomonas endolithica TaxID=2972485 RepID=UPI0021AF519B|nr:hypothetical protein [Sphingomonas sp. ZFBP2030]